MESITLPANLRFIGERAFAYCDNLESIIIPSHVGEEIPAANNPWPDKTIVKYIEDYAFEYCTSLKTATINATILGDYIFNYCTALESVNFTTVSTINIGAFNHCEGLKNINNSAQESSINIPSSVTTILDYAFNYNVSMEHITIPSTVTFIGKYVFAYNNQLETATINSNNSVT